MGLQITVTHLTRMSGDRICVAGLTDDAEFVRPDCSEYLRRSDVPGLFALGARVDLGRVRREGSPPQTENVTFSREQARLLDVRELDEIEPLLAASAVNDLNSAFGTELRKTSGGALYVRPRTGTGSLTTVRLNPGDLRLRRSFGKVRGRWEDAAIGQCERPATDLVLYPRADEDADLARMNELQDRSERCDALYLSVGLGKQYAPPGLPAGHWVQLNNVLCVMRPQVGVA